MIHQHLKTIKIPQHPVPQKSSQNDPSKMQLTSLFVKAALLSAATVNAVCYNCYMGSNSYLLESTTCNGLEGFELNGTRGWLYKGCDATCPGCDIFWAPEC